MSKVVCIDSTIFVWGIKRQASPGQEHKIPQAVRFIQWLEEEDYKILIPVPVITELLSYKVTNTERDSVLNMLSTKNILVKPFDIACALKCAELLHLSYTEREKEEYEEVFKAPKAKIKYDSMIAATAIVNKCNSIYADDGDIERYAHGQISVLPMPILAIPPTQTDLWGGNPPT